MKPLFHIVSQNPALFHKGNINYKDNDFKDNVLGKKVEHYSEMVDLQFVVYHLLYDV